MLTFFITLRLKTHFLLFSRIFVEAHCDFLSVRTSARDVADPFIFDAAPCHAARAARRGRPLNKNDRSVHLSQGDLMLCNACERYRFLHRSSLMLVASKNTWSDKSANKATSDRSATTDMDHSANIASCDGATRECTSATGDRNTQCSTDHADISINELLSYVNF